MKMLAIDFSSSRRSVAARNGARVHAVTTDDPKNTRALELIGDALQGVGLDRRAVEVVAVGLGPGSYTGIRASLALAQGWQLATRVRLAGISSADAVAWQAHAEGKRGDVAVVIDAQRGEVYCPTYELTTAEVKPRDKMRIVSIAEAQALRDAGMRMVGPEISRWFPEGEVIFPRAERLLELADSVTSFVPGQQLEPIYLRESSFVKAPPARHIPTD